MKKLLLFRFKNVHKKLTLRTTNVKINKLIEVNIQARKEE